MVGIRAARGPAPRAAEPPGSLPPNGLQVAGGDALNPVPRPSCRRLKLRKNLDPAATQGQPPLISVPRSLHLRGARPPRRQPGRADQARKSGLSALGVTRQKEPLALSILGLVGLSQPDVSRLLRGHFRDFSLERLLRLLLALDRDIEIVIRRRPRSRSRSRLSVEGLARRKGPDTFSSVQVAAP